MDRLLSRTDPLTNVERYQYDATGDLAQFTDRRGKITTYTYDSLNRKTLAGFGTAVGTPSTYDSTIAYSYDAGNRLASAVDSVTGTIKPTYDKLDRLLSEQTAQGTVSYAYDAAGRRTQMTVAGQAGVNYAYDNANRLLHITQGSSTVSFGYDSGNRRTSLTLPNGIVMSYSYDNASELTGIGYTNGSTNLGSLSYGYDLAGRRTSMGGSLAQTALPLAVNEAEYNADNQLTEWGTAGIFYDPNGNMTSDGVNSYIWNARNQLASMNSSVYSFQYDGYGRRTGKTISGTTTNFLYDGAYTVQELSGSTVTANLLTGLGVDERFTRTDSSGAANFLTDALGSTLGLTNSSGSSLAQYAYEPFGNTTVTSGSSTNSYEYTGRENDGTGLYFNRARYYSSALARFISEDPIGIAGGIDLYAYVANNPITFSDPFGRDKTRQMTPMQRYQQWVADQNRPATDADRMKALNQAGNTADTGVKVAIIVTAPNYLVLAADAGGVEIAKNIVQGVENVGNEIVVPAMQQVGALIETYAPYGIGLKGAMDLVQGFTSSRNVPASNEGIVGWYAARAIDAISKH